MGDFCYCDYPCLHCEDYADNCMACEDDYFYQPFDSVCVTEEECVEMNFVLNVFDDGF